MEFEFVLVESAEQEWSEVERPDSVGDLFESDVFLVEEQAAEFRKAQTSFLINVVFAAIVSLVAIWKIVEGRLTTFGLSGPALLEDAPKEAVLAWASRQLLGSERLPFRYTFWRGAYFEYPCSHAWTGGSAPNGLRFSGERSGAYAHRLPRWSPPEGLPRCKCINLPRLMRYASGARLPPTSSEPGLVGWDIWTSGALIGKEEK